MTGVALGFHPQLYEVPGAGKPFGATVASTAFLRALVDGEASGALAVCLEGDATEAAATAMLGALGLARPARAVDGQELAAIGTLHLPHPALAAPAWERYRRGVDAYSLTGVAHAVASPGALKAIAELAVAPLAPWDAVICPSTALRDVVARVLGAEAEYLSWRVGATVRPPLPELAVIPLGVDVSRFASDPGRRAAWRSRIGAGPDDVVLLYVGRLSAGRKANPLALMLAAEAVARRRPERLVIAMAGWFADDRAARAFAATAAKACPSVPVHFLDGRAPAVRDAIWSAGDVFVSLVDNIQETFGLSPVEAMAAGLPVVASDWDGYRETVRDGIDGMLVPTAMPAAPFGAALADRIGAADGRLDFLSAVSQTVSVSVEAAAAALERLVADPALRRRMGDAGRARAADFAWPVVIARYRALWSELAMRRAAAAPSDAPPRSDRLDPYAAFAHYPTRRIGPDTGLRLAAGATAGMLVERHRLGHLRLDPALFPSATEYRQLFDRIAAGPASAGSVAAMLDADRRALAMRGIAVLAKLGLIVLDDPQRVSR